jgi:hypothetical protein
MVDHFPVVSPTFSVDVMLIVEVSLIHDRGTACHMYDFQMLYAAWTSKCPRVVWRRRHT